MKSPYTSQPIWSLGLLLAALGVGGALWAVWVIIGPFLLGACR